MTLKLCVPLNLLGAGVVLLVALGGTPYQVHAAVPRNLEDKKLSSITLDEYLEGKFYAQGFPGQWAPDSDNLIRMFRPADILDHDILTGENKTVLVTKDIIDRLGTEFSNIIFSKDQKFALIEHGRSSIWRYSTRAKYDIYNLETKTLTKLQPLESANDPKQKELQLVKWAPNSNGIAFVADYNIYFRENADEDTPTRKLTNDGSEELAIYNGIADWVYEEEMFGGPTALWISPSASTLAFVRFNDSNVKDFQWPVYGEPRGEETIYPEHRSIRYPKAGFDNPQADVYIISLSDSLSTPKKLEYSDSTANELIGTVLWTTDKDLMVVTTNRVQTKSETHLCAVDTSTCRKIHTYEPKGGWVDMHTPKVSKDGSKYITIESVKQADSDRSYYHIVMFKPDETASSLTKGQLSVSDILGWDEENHKIYFTGSFWNGSVADPSHTQVYYVHDNETDADPVCITCTLKNKAGETCNENSVILSAKFSHFIHRCGGPGIPETTTRSTQTGENIQNPGPTYVGNEQLRESLSSKLVPITKDYVIETKDGFVGRARLLIPANYDPSKKYPLLISVYGGPGSQNIKQNFGVQWETSLVSDKNIIFGYIDGRGTQKQSTDHLFTLHRKLGTAEIEDQIIVTKWLTENLSFIDANKTSIWGWSYGGYATAKVLETDVENVFKCGISVAPVTSWRYYDTIYTERYMGLPSANDNLKSYNDSDLISKDHVENLRNKQYMLVHGNADDNVHYQQSMIFARALEQNDVFFHQLSYPDENHGINGPGMRRHLYHSLQRFLFDECYKTSTPESSKGTGTENTGTSVVSKNPVFGVLISVMVLSGFNTFW